MNRSIQAFAVLFVSLAGGMLAATWTSTWPQSRRATLASSQELGVHCSCNPESLIRFEEGCSRDKTTGELYGCGLGLGKNGTGGKSVITRGANDAISSLLKTPSALSELVSAFQGWALQGKELVAQLDSLKIQIRNPKSEIRNTIAQPATPDALRTEQDYAAAELAAAGFDPRQNSLARFLEPIRRVPSFFTERFARDIFRNMESQLEGLHRTCDRQSRLWLVEMGLHHHWDAAEASQKEQRLAGMLLLMDYEHLDRWFEDFPRPITQPDRLLNPSAPQDDSSEESRRTILAAAQVLESLSALLHQTAENLTRHAEQDVAKLHKLKSGIEERR